MDETNPDLARSFKRKEPVRVRRSGNCRPKLTVKFSKLVAEFLREILPDVEPQQKFYMCKEYC